MTGKHDFKAVLDRIEPCKYAVGEDYYIDVGDVRHIKAIQAALRIADKVQSGELKMEQDDAIDNYYDDGYRDGWNNCLEAMSAQLLKEISDE